MLLAYLHSGAHVLSTGSLGLVGLVIRDSLLEMGIEQFENILQTCLSDVDRAP